MHSILITGTDTGIGKTRVAGIIARVQVVKPVEFRSHPFASFPNPAGRSKVPS